MSAARGPLDLEMEAAHAAEALRYWIRARFGRSRRDEARATMTGVPANCPMTRNTAATADPGTSNESASQTRFSRPPSTKKVESQTRSFGDDAMAAMGLSAVSLDTGEIGLQCATPYGTLLH